MFIYSSMSTTLQQLWVTMSNTNREKDKSCFQCPNNYSVPGNIVAEIEKLSSFNVIQEIMDNTSWHDIITAERNMLLCAAWYGHSELIDTILCDWSNDNGQTSASFDNIVNLAIFVAAYNGHYPVMKELLSHATVPLQNVSVNVSCLANLPYLAEAEKQWMLVKFFKYESIQFLDLVFSSDNVDLLKYVCVFNDMFSAKWCYFPACEWGAVKCLQYMINSFDGVHNLNRIRFSLYGMIFTPLMVAVQNSYTCTKFILDNLNANVNDTDRMGNNALHYAISRTTVRHKNGDDLFQSTACIRPNLQWEIIELDDYCCINNTFSGKQSSEVVTNRDDMNRFHVQYPNLRTVGKETISIVELLISRGCSINQLGTDPLFMEEMSIEKLQNIVKPFTCVILQCFNFKAGLHHYTASMHANSPDIKRQRQHLEVLERLFQYLKGTEMQLGSPWSEYEFPPWTVWNLITCKYISEFKPYLSKLSGFGEPTENSATDKESIFSSLQMSVFCLSQILKHGHKENSKRLFNQSTRAMTINKITSYLIQIFNSNCNHAERALPNPNSTKECINTIKHYLKDIISLHLMYGIDLSSDVLKILEDQKTVCDEVCNVLFDPVLCILCSLSHDEFYTLTKCIGKAENNAAHVLKKQIQKMNLDCNTRPLSHLARLCIYEKMNKCYTHGLANITSSRFLQNYLLTFIY